MTVLSRTVGSLGSFETMCLDGVCCSLQCQRVQMCLKDGAVCDFPDDVRQRNSSYGQVQGPLAVSGSRGVAFVPSGKQRAVVYDLVEDEEEPDVDDSMDNDDD